MADSQIHVALAGNPNCGKTTLFNLITGANGYVGNWPGVTVEKKEAKLLSDKNVTITDLPGIYSLSPYSPEEQCSRDYLMSGEPDVVVQVVDATNLERNLYLALQVIETGLPVVVALNMADLVEKNGDKIDTNKLSKKLGCPVMMISALKNKGITELFEQVKKSAASKGQVPEHKFDSSIEDVLDHIENNLPASVPANKRRYYAVKLFERDADACKLINLTKEKAARVEELVAQCEKDCDDDAESIITGERYGVIAHIIDECLTKAPAKMSTSEKIDRVVTNRILGLPIFVVIMFAVYYIAVSTLGGTVTDFTNDQLFGTDGWFVLGQGRDAYDEAAGEYTQAQAEIAAFIDAADAKGIDVSAYNDAIDAEDGDAAADALKTIAAEPEAASVKGKVEEDEDAGTTAATVTASQAVKDLDVTEPDPADYGPFVPGITTAVHNALVAGGTEDGGLVDSLVCDGIVAGIGAIMGFVPQMFLLFVMLSFLEDCGYMARVAFIMDRIFRRFGLSGKSFIPMLVSSGCGVPGVMSTKTIENEKDRRLTVMTTTFIPCGAKLPIIALLMGSIIGGSSTTAKWISPLFYFLGVFAVIASGLMLKRPSSSPVARRRSLWSFLPTTSRRSALGRCTCGSAAGPLSRRPARSSSRPLSWFGSCPTLVATTVPLATCPRWTASPRSIWTTPCLPCSATWSPGSSPRLALAPGRQQRCPSRALSPRRTSSPPPARCCPSPTRARPTRACGPRLPLCSPRWVPASPLARSTCCALRALLPWVPSATRWIPASGSRLPSVTSASSLG